MNKRIKELAEQVGFGNAWLEEAKPGYPALPREGMLKEFAELIICASAQFLVDKFDFCGNEILAAEELAKNFGVEWTFRIEE